jgi:hypothetical protein
VGQSDDRGGPEADVGSEQIVLGVVGVHRPLVGDRAEDPLAMRGELGVGVIDLGIVRVGLMSVRVSSWAGVECGWVGVDRVGEGG